MTQIKCISAEDIASGILKGGLKPDEMFCFVSSKPSQTALITKPKAEHDTEVICVDYETDCKLNNSGLSGTFGTKHDYLGYNLAATLWDMTNAEPSSEPIESWGEDEEIQKRTKVIQGPKGNITLPNVIRKPGNTFTNKRRKF